MDEGDKKIIDQMIKDAVKAALDFKSRKVGDTPTDANQLTPLKFVNTKSISTPGGQSITGSATLNGGTNIYVTQSGSIITINQSVTGAAVADVQIFTVPSTLSWSKPAGAKVVEVYCIGGGGGGAGGDPNEFGGWGGAGGAWSYKKIAASVLSSVETVVVGNGGIGGVNAGGFQSRDGSVGGASKFGTNPYVWAPGGEGGFRGSTSVRSVGVKGFGDISYAGGSGGGADSSTEISPRGGGDGGLPVSGGQAEGQKGGSFITYYTKAGGLGGQSCVGIGCTAFTGASGSVTSEYIFIGGVGGGGGGAGQNVSSTTGANGGAGGFPGGGGGGGGFGSSNGSHGTGGVGGDGLVGVITYF